MSVLDDALIAIGAFNLLVVVLASCSPFFAARRRRPERGRTRSLSRS